MAGMLKGNLDMYTMLVSKDLDLNYRDASNSLAVVQHQLLVIEEEERAVAAKKAKVLETVTRMKELKKQVGEMIKLREDLRVSLANGEPLGCK